VARREHTGFGGRLLRVLLPSSAAGVAPLYIVLNALCAALLVWMPYTLLVEFSMLLSVPSILLFMWSFVALRIQRPYVERPFLIPGGLTVAILITVIPVAVSVAYAVIITTETVGVEGGTDEERSSEARSRSSDGGMPPLFQVATALGVIAVGLVVHLIARHCSSSSSSSSSRRRRSSRHGERYGDHGPESVFGDCDTPLPPLPAAMVRMNGHAQHEEELEAFNGDSSAFVDRRAGRSSRELMGGDDGGDTAESQSRSLLREYGPT